MHRQIWLLLNIYIAVVYAKWKLVWHEEFNGTSLNLKEWKFETGCGKANYERQCYTLNKKANARVEKGHLVIDVKIESNIKKGFHFTSARLNSKKAWAFGKFDTYASLPRGKHLWPAIWLLPKDNVYGPFPASGEIDIMENDGLKNHIIMGTIHFGGVYPNYISRGSGAKHFPQDFSKGFHLFGFEWDPKEMRWYVDGKCYHKERIDKNLWSHKGKNPYTKKGQPFDQAFYWVLNIAVGGSFFGKGPYVTPQEAKHWKKPTMEIDYIRVYECV